MYKRNRNNMVSYVLASAMLTLGLASAAAADSESGFRHVGGKIGWAYLTGPSASQYPAALAPDVDPAEDGFRYVGGRVGWAYVAGRGATDLPGTLPADVPADQDGFHYVGGEVGWAFDARRSGPVSRIGVAETGRDADG